MSFLISTRLFITMFTAQVKRTPTFPLLQYTPGIKWRDDCHKRRTTGKILKHREKHFPENGGIADVLIVARNSETQNPQNSNFCMPGCELTCNIFVVLLLFGRLQTKSFVSLTIHVKGIRRAFFACQNGGKFLLHIFYVSEGLKKNCGQLLGIFFKTVPLLSL